ncbi:MAG TPA: hypothetical protein EYO58_02250, partial [Flavobacteriales bacterium]|nr:hypothetical protein [Flavobacteriales bacterium]
MTSICISNIGSKENPYLNLPIKERIKGYFYLHNGEVRYWDGKILRCEHKKRRNTCKDCGGSSICEHNTIRSECKYCDGGSRCEHKRQRSTCKDCDGGGICIHDKRRSICKDCGGSGICIHNRIRSTCKDCGGGGICKHDRIRSICKDCGGGSICKHDRIRSSCKDCNPEGHLASCLRGRLWSALKAHKASKNERTMEYINCSVKHAYQYIESQFTDGMNWENHGKDNINGERGWEVDHRRPCKSFDLNDEEQKY